MGKTDNGRLGTGGRDYFQIDDGHTMGSGPDWPKQGKGSSGADHTGTLQPYEGSSLHDDQAGGSQDIMSGVGAMPMKTLGSMSPNNYGKDLGPDATNSLGTFDGDSDGNGTDDANDPMLQPRPGTAQFRI